jgi:hypothetical protein
MYDSDMAVYLASVGGKKADRTEVIRRNIELNRAWAKEGK